MFRKSNKWDSTKDILLTECRQWDLKERERQKNVYTKRKLEYWSKEINKSRKERRILSDISNSHVFIAEPEEEIDTHVNNSHDYEKFTMKELIALIKEKGLQRKGLSKLRKHQLIALLEESQ